MRPWFIPYILARPWFIYSLCLIGLVWDSHLFTFLVTFFKLVYNFSLLCFVNSDMKRTIGCWKNFILGHTV